MEKANQRIQILHTTLPKSLFRKLPRMAVTTRTMTTTMEFGQHSGPKKYRTGKNPHDAQTKLDRVQARNGTGRVVLSGRKADLIQKSGQSELLDGLRNPLIRTKPPVKRGAARLLQH
jgi:hypothetical protein